MDNTEIKNNSIEKVIYETRFYSKVLKLLKARQSLRSSAEQLPKVRQLFRSSTE